MSNRVSHFEIMSENPKANMKFFKSAFGWKFIKFDKDSYWLTQTGDSREEGIHGASCDKWELTSQLLIRST